MWGAIIGAAVSLFGSKLSSDASKSAAQTQASAETEAARIIEKQFKVAEERLAPFVEGSQEAFQKQQAASGALGPEAQQVAFDEFVESPGVAFAREQGLKAINQNASASGTLRSGNTQKALIEYAQGLAEQDYGNYFNRLGTITGTGLAAAQAIAGVGSQAAQGQATQVASAGRTTAAGQVAGAQSYATGIQNAYGAIANSP